MSKIIDTDIFIEMARKVHGDRYDYSCTKYEKSAVKVDIICRDHGLFSQTPNSHLQGRGCKLCSDKFNGNNLRSNTEEFINKSIEIHGYKYDYSLVKYETNSSVVDIICPIHGCFKQKSAVHLRGNGCPLCGQEKVASLKRSNLDEFIYKSNLKHNNKYSYCFSEYINARTKLKIICPIHGEFFQVPHTHINGAGCPKCANEEDRYNENKFGLTRWIEMGESSKNYDSFKIYIIKCKSISEEFIKIGRTYTSIEARFGSTILMPYNYEVLATFSDNPYHIFKLEAKLKRMFKKHKYIPLQTFSGMQECFSMEILNDKNINNYVNT